MKTIVSTGSRGMVGSYLNEVFKGYELVLTDLEEMDVRDISKVKSFISGKKKIDYILHLAAETDLERCEKEKEHAFMTNVIGTANMVMMAERKDIPIIYISTAGIFDGKKESSYKEEDKANPINYYGLSKYYGEMAVKSYYKHYIFRAGWMMGGGEMKDKKFVKKIIAKSRDNLDEGINKIYVLNDYFGSPTYAKDMLFMIREVLEKHLPYGVYNCAGGGKGSRFEVAREVINLMGIKIKVAGVGSERFEKEDKGRHFCDRSKNEVLVNNKLKRYGLVMRDWKSALKEYIKEF